MKTYPVVLTIAGSDSSGGAGIQADIKAISANGCYAASVITALTAQNTQGVQKVYDLPATFIADQLDSVFSDLTINAVKIGMLNSADIIEVVAQKLKHYQAKNIILDPVMMAKDGSYLIQPDAIAALKYFLLSEADLITPNLPEAYHLLDHQTQIQNSLVEDLANLFKTSILLKGGHAGGETVEDCFYDYQQKKLKTFSHPRINTKNSHGTGCTLSAAIAADLARGNDLSHAIEQAEKYLVAALNAGSHYQLGKDKGPVHHFYHYWQ